MKAPKGYILTGKTVERLEKEARRVEYLHEKMRNIAHELYEIQDENSWQNYLGNDSYANITDEEARRFCAVHDTINGAYNNRPR